MRLEPCADVIVSAAARRSISVGGAPPVKKYRRGAAWAVELSNFAYLFERFSVKNLFYKDMHV